ncbi:MAG TPA: type IV pilus assembly protein PilM [Actinomycetota bacterium]|nr:type IV pilus assembly protein PilM [Actinomycetota bacterium]
MARTRVGVDVGSTAVRVAEVAAGDVPVIVRAAQVSLPPGAVEAGEVRQPEPVAEALRELWSKSGVKSKQVYLGVGNQRIVVREVAIPWLPEKELRETLSFQVQEFIPMPPDEAVLDFDPLGELDQGGRRMQRILLVAAHKAMIGPLVDAVQAAKLEPQGIDLTPFAVVRAVGTGDEALDLDRPGDEAVVDIGAHVTSICVHDRGITRFVRMLPSGGRDISLAVARGLSVSDEDAERVKRGETVATEDGEVDLAEVRRLALARAGSFVDEVRSSLEFYAAQVPGARIARVIVTGGGSRLDGFLELLQDRIPVPVDRGRVFERCKSELDLTAEAAVEAEAVLAAAVGLAIPEKGRS